MPYDPSSIRKVRKVLGMTQAEFGKALAPYRVGGNKGKAVRQSSIHRWETGVVSPNANNLGAIWDLARGRRIKQPRFFVPPQEG